MTAEFIGDGTPSREPEWLVLDDFRYQVLSDRIRQAVLVIGGAPLLVLVVLAVWNLPVWEGQQ
jgi:hypothetical protein